MIHVIGLSIIESELQKNLPVIMSIIGPRQTRDNRVRNPRAPYPPSAGYKLIHPFFGGMYSWQSVALSRRGPRPSWPSHQAHLPAAPVGRCQPVPHTPSILQNVMAELRPCFFIFFLKVIPGTSGNSCHIGSVGWVGMGGRGGGGGGGGATRYDQLCSFAFAASALSSNSPRSQ